MICVCDSSQVLAAICINASPEWNEWNDAVLYHMCALPALDLCASLAASIVEGFGERMTILCDVRQLVRVKPAWQC